MLNSHCNNNDKKHKKDLCGHRDSNPRYMDSKTTVVSTTLWRPMILIDINNQYNYAEKNFGCFRQLLCVLIHSYE